MEPQRKRTSNFTADEKRVLSELVLKYQNIIENKQTDATTNTDKLKGWIRLAEEFNNISTYCHRPYLTLKCCWENIKRQAKKNRAERKKNIFMTGGGKPSTPPPKSNQESDKIVDAVLGPALEGNPNLYDSDAVINEISSPVEILHYGIEEEIAPAGMSEQNNVNIMLIDAQDDKTVTVREDTYASTSKGILKENNVCDNWNSWSPKNLKTPVSDPLKVTKTKDEDWLKRRRPRNESLSDLLTKEKIHLVKILQENAVQESKIRLAILEEQLKQEKSKTQKDTDK